jgi:hypothetical protein
MRLCKYSTFAGPRLPYSGDLRRYETGAKAAKFNPHSDPHTWLQIVDYVHAFLLSVNLDELLMSIIEYELGALVTLLTFGEIQETVDRILIDGAARPIGESSANWNGVFSSRAGEYLRV